LGILEDIISKLDELERLSAFVRRFIDTARSPEWKEMDPDLTLAKQVYKGLRQKMIDKTNELPTP